MAGYRIVYKNEVSHGLLSSFKSKSKYIGGFIKGKNTSAYNHDYYLKNKFRWQKNKLNIFGKNLDFLNGFWNNGEKPIEIADDISEPKEVASVKNETRKFKYIYKVQNSAGKWRYFYSEAEYISFMNNVKRKDPNKEWSMEEDAKAINPNYNENNSEYSHNCPYTSLAYDLRRRGYDVQAIGVKDGDGETKTTIETWYKNGKYVEAVPMSDNDKKLKDAYQKNLDTKNGQEAELKYFAKALYGSEDKIDDVLKPENNGRTIALRDPDKEMSSAQKQECAEKLIDTLSKQGDGARGFLSVQWTSGGGHSVAYEVKNNKVYVCDGQIGTVWSAEDFFYQDKYGRYMKWGSSTAVVLNVDGAGNYNFKTIDNSSVSYMRTDNLELTERARKLFISNGENDQDTTADIPRDAHVVKVTDPKEIEDFYNNERETRKKESK